MFKSILKLQTHVVFLKQTTEKAPTLIKLGAHLPIFKLYCQNIPFFSFRKKMKWASLWSVERSRQHSTMVLIEYEGPVKRCPHPSEIHTVKTVGTDSRCDPTVFAQLTDVSMNRPILDCFSPPTFHLLSAERHCQSETQWLDFCWRSSARDWRVFNTAVRWFFSSLLWMRLKFLTSQGTRWNKVNMQIICQRVYSMHSVMKTRGWTHSANQVCGFCFSGRVKNKGQRENVGQLNILQCLARQHHLDRSKTPTIIKIC